MTAKKKMSLVIPKTLISTNSINWQPTLEDRAILDDPHNVDPSRVQPLAYATIWRSEVEGEKPGMYVLQYVRSKGGTESRLHDLLSVGFGGHIDEEMIVTMAHSFVESLERELVEELGFYFDPRVLWRSVLRSMASHRIIYIPTDDVGSVHVGLSVMLSFQEQCESLELPFNSETVALNNFSPEKLEIAKLSWQRLEDIIETDLSNYEPWSNAIIAAYFTQRLEEIASAAGMQNALAKPSEQEPAADGQEPEQVAHQSV